MQHRGECDRDGHWAAGRGGGGRHGHGGFGGHGRRHGMGDDDMMRPGRMLGQGDLKLVALVLIAEQPRHGYDIIKLLEDKTDGWYAPSPGIVYPTLTYLEEAGYAAATMDGAKKLYAITEEGRAYLADNRAAADAVIARLDSAGERIARMRERFGDGEQAGRLPPLVRAALDNLRAVAAKRLGEDAEAETSVVEILARAAADVRRS
jgi:DNA-binding PadR family transcriptional regulator